MTSSLALRRQEDVFTLPLPPGKQEYVYFDDGKPKDRVHGLALRIREGGSRKWVYMYRWGGKLRRDTIGDASNNSAGWTLAKARAQAAEWRLLVNNKKDPRRERELAEASATNFKTLKEAITAYLAKRGPHMKPRSHAETSRHLEVHWKPLHSRAVHEIDGDMIADRLKEIEAESGPVARNRARSSLSAMYAWAIGERFSRHLKANPVATTLKTEEAHPRDRVLTDKELVTIWKAAPDNSYGRIVKLLMLTGQRREEIGGLCWSEVKEDKKQLELPPQRTKNSRPHDVPLSDLALSVLKGAHMIRGHIHVFGDGVAGFSNWSRSKEELDAVAKVKGWTLHDLRRTAATRMADLGVQPHIIEAVLNHISGHKAGVAGIYNRSAYAPEKRAALDLLASHIRLILAKSEGANVTKLAKARG
jgi:integrase